MRITLEISSKAEMLKAADMLSEMLGDAEVNENELFDSIKRTIKKYDDMFNDLFEPCEGAKVTVKDAKLAMNDWLNEHTECAELFDCVKRGGRLELTKMNTLKNRKFVNWMRGKDHAWNKLCRVKHDDGTSSIAQCVTNLKLKR